MPTDAPLRRKLAAILAADVVGYSMKMGESEERTLRNLKLCRAITDKSIVDHHAPYSIRLVIQLLPSLPVPWTL